MAEPVLFALGGLDRLDRSTKRLLCALQRGPGLADGLPHDRLDAEGVEQARVIRRVSEPHLVALSLDFHQEHPGSAKQGHADGLVVDAGPGSPVAAHDAADDDLVLQRDAVLLEQRQRGV